VLDVEEELGDWFARRVELFSRAVGPDDDTWRRACGWSAWKRAITLIDQAAAPFRRQEPEHALPAILEDSGTDR
jgi:hypothetical protein